MKRTPPPRPQVEMTGDKAVLDFCLGLRGGQWLAANMTKPQKLDVAFEAFKALPENKRADALMVAITVALMCANELKIDLSEQLLEFLEL